MGLVAPINDGKVVETSSQNSLKKTASEKNGMDKDSFLQLLVAQMKYQDPLEPTSNTEYISQYAQFSQVEQMQNMSGSMDLQRASQLVGQEVYVKTKDSSGNTELIQGRVDSVVYENGKAFLSINESLYSIDDVDSVVDPKYLNAYNKASDLVVSLNKLPGLNSIDLSNKETIERLQQSYQEMTDYEKSFVAGEKVKDLDAYVARLQEILNKASEAEKSEETTEENSEKPIGED